MIDDAMRFLLVFAVGAAGQLLDGTLGMGFGVFSASMLLAAGFTPLTVVSTVNIAKILTGLFSGLAHWRAGNVRRTWLLCLVISGVIGGTLAAYLLVSVTQDRFRFWTAAVLTGMGLLILCRSLFPAFFSFGSCSGEIPVRFRRGLFLGILGLAAGFLNAASAAYGPLATSGVMLIAKSKPSVAVGTVSVAEIFVAGSVISTFLFQKGFYVPSWDLALALVIGGALTAWPAAWVCRKLPPKALQFGVGLALITLNLGVVISDIR
jgi:uncharacterized membrane protein YfcA